MADQSASTPSNNDPQNNNPGAVPANNDNPTPPPPSQEPGKRKSPSPINQKYLEEITLIRDILPAARDASRTAALTESGWDAARITGLEDKATALENAGLAAVGRSKAREMDTAGEEAARQALLTALHPIRTGAKRKYRNTANAAAGRSTYFVNEKTSVSLERLLFIAGSVLLKLTSQSEGGTPEDTLPGVTSAVLDTLTSTRANYVHADDAQHETDRDKLQAHLDVDQAFIAARGERIDLQLAADQIWSHHDPANSATRRAFKIPADRPMSE